MDVEKSETSGKKRFTPRDYRPVAKVAGFVIFLIACAAVAYFPGVRERANFDWVNAQPAFVTEFFNRPYGPAVFLAVSILFLVLHMPGLLMVVVGALVYTPVTAFFSAWAGSVLGTTVMFLIARYLLRDYFRPKLEKSFMRKFLSRLESRGIVTMSFMRTMMFMFPPVNWLMGASNISFRDYTVGNMIGLAPIVFAVQLATRRLKQIRSTSDLVNAETIAVLGGFCAALGLIVWLRRRYLTGPTQNGEPTR